MRPRENFGSDSQYKRYLLAVEYAEKIREFQDKGYIILEPDGSLLKGTMCVPDDDDWAAVKTVEDGCSMGFICFAYGEDGIPWIEDTIKEIHTMFRKYMCVNPKDVHRVQITKSKYVKKFIKEKNHGKE